MIGRPAGRDRSRPHVKRRPCGSSGAKPWRGNQQLNDPMAVTPLRLRSFLRRISRVSTSPRESHPPWNRREVHSETRHAMGSVSIWRASDHRTPPIIVLTFRRKRLRLALGVCLRPRSRANQSVSTRLFGTVRTQSCLTFRVCPPITWSGTR
jgi:hypothetical protein